METVEVDVGSAAFVTAQAGCVDSDEAVTVEIKVHIDTVARRAWHFADDHPFGLSKRVDEGAFAHVATTNDGDFHSRSTCFNGIRLKFWHARKNFVEERLFASILKHADRNQPTSSKSMEFVRGIIEAWVIRLICQQQHWLFDLHEPFCDVFIQRYGSGFSVYYEKQYVGVFNSYRDLMFDVFGKIIDVFDAHPANVLRDESGVILPIDLILLTAGDELAAQLEAAREGSAR